LSQKTGIKIDDSENIKINGNGIIKNFQNGLLTNSDNQINISSINLQNNEMGVFLTESRNFIIQDSYFKFNDVSIALHTDFNIELVNNTLDSDHLAGITLVGTSESTISGNKVKGSVNGIFLDGHSNSNLIDSNSAFDNRRVDLNNGNGLSTEINENDSIDNKCDTSVPNGLCINK